MAKKPKRKLTTAEKAARARHKAQFMTVFLNGRQKKVRRPEYIGGQPADDFIARNADPLWLHQNEMWELIADPIPIPNTISNTLPNTIPNTIPDPDPDPDEGCLASPDDELFWA